MTTSNYITFILLGVIGLVFLIDFILNSRKKSLEKSVEKFVEKEGSLKDDSNPLSWILKRKKNITLSLVLIPILKVLAHYFFYTERYPGRIYPEKLSYKAKSFGFHLDKVFNDKLELFIPVIIIFLIVVWFFSDKIKVR